MLNQRSLKLAVKTLFLIAATGVVSTTSIPVGRAAIAPTPNSNFSDTGKTISRKVSAELETQMNQGINALNAGNYTEALTFFEQVVALAPNLAAAHLGKGISLCYLERFPAAIAALEKTLQKEATKSPGWKWLCAALSMNGEPEAALAAYDRAIALNPNDSWFYHFRGMTLMSLEQHESALAAFDQAVQLNPTLVAAWMNRGLTANSLGQREEALASFERVLGINPNHVDAWYYKGVALAEMGRTADAIAVFEQVLALDPSYARATDYLARLRDNLPG